MTDAELLAMASAFDVVPYNGRAPMGAIRTITVERRNRDPESWAIVSDGFNLNRDGEWEYCPLPSSRTDAFLARCRWTTALEAIAFAQAHMALHPTGYKPSD